MKQMNTFNLEPNNNEEKIIEEDHIYKGSTLERNSEKKSSIFKNKKLLIIIGAAALVIILIIIIVLKSSKTLTPSLQLSRIEVNVGESVLIKSNLTKENYDKLSWYTEDKEIATVIDGEVKGIGEGITNIRASFPQGASEMVEVTVRLEVPDFAIAGGNLEMRPGESKTLNLLGALAVESSWTSTMPLVASVKEGTVTAHNSGNTTIIAKAVDGRESKILLTVKGEQAAPLSMVIEPLKNIKVGESYKLVINTQPSNAVKIFTYESTNTSVATVDQTGTVKIISKGEAAIKVKSYNGVITAIMIKVN